MVKNLLILKILTVIIFISLSNISIADDSTIFRNIKWGDSLDEVKKSELPNSIYKSGDDYIAYKGKMADRDCVIMYKFTNSDKLYKIHCFFNINDERDRSAFLKYIYGIFKDNGKYKEKEESGLIGDSILTFGNSITDVSIVTTNKNLTITYIDKEYADREKKEAIKNFDDKIEELMKKREKHLKEF